MPACREHAAGDWAQGFLRRDAAGCCDAQLWPQMRAEDSVRATTRLRCQLKPAAENAVRRGHPWVFSESIVDQNREGVAGELAVIYDRRDRFLAVGLFDPGAPLRIRVRGQERKEPYVGPDIEGDLRSCRQAEPERRRLRFIAEPAPPEDLIRDPLIAARP